MPNYELIYETKTYYYISSYGTTYDWFISTIKYLEKKYNKRACILSKDSYVPKKVKEWIDSLENKNLYALIQIRK